MKQYKLPKDFTERWIKALRSGEYTQGTHYLARKTIVGCEYCCIGVAGLVAGVKTEIMERKNLFGSGNYNDIQRKSIPEELRTKRKGVDQLPVKLSQMNDHGKTFPEIADWIEQNVELI